MNCCIGIGMHTYAGHCLYRKEVKPVTTGQYRVVASIAYEYPGELYSETFIMEGKSESDVRGKVNALLADKRFIIAIRKV